MPAIYPYTVTNSYKGGLNMRTYARNVRRAWDGDDYRAPKRQRLDNTYRHNMYVPVNSTNENASYAFDLEDNLERAIRETSVAALSSSPSRKNSTVCSWNDHDHDHDHDHNQSVQVTTLTPPSSPPPAALHVTPPNVKPRKPTFSFMEKKKKEKEKMKTAKRKLDTSTNGASVPAAREDSEPLAEILNSSSRVVNQSTHAQPSTQKHLSQEPSPSAPSVKPPALQKNLTQTVLDFGQCLTPITCAHCHMSYTPSVPEDTQLHDMYHNRHKSGIELPKAFSKSAMKWCYEVPHISGSVVVVDRKTSIPGRRVVQRVLEVVNRELGSVEIPESELWGQKTLDTFDDENGEVSQDESAKKVDRYKVYLHVMDGRCVGVCLGERIAKGYKVKGVAGLDDSTAPKKAASGVARGRTPTESPDTSSQPGEKEKSTDSEEGAHSMPTPTSTSPNLTHTDSCASAPSPPASAATIAAEANSSSSSSSSADLVLDSEPTAAIAGISRIWTSATYRRQGIAANLIDCVMNQFVYGLEMQKDQVAFSQPTEPGVRFARGWFGEEKGWLVYHES